MSRKREKKQQPEAYGWYKYKNISGADFVLPRPLINGRTVVPVDGTFEADSSYQNMIDIKLIENLSHFIENTPNKHSLNDVIKPKNEPEEIKINKQEEIKVNEPEEIKVLIEQPVSENLEFFESDGTPIKKISNKEKSAVDLTKKELIEFARFKNIKVHMNMNKEQILEKIRKNQ